MDKKCGFCDSKAIGQSNHIGYCEDHYVDVILVGS
jgi:hypothetical protein